MLRLPGLRLLDEAALPVGTAASSSKLEEARRRLVAYYLELGYVFVRVNYRLERSQDQTRARVRFDIVEGEPVVISGVTIRGNRTTRDAVIRERVALKIGARYSTAAAATTRERLALLGVFSSIDVAIDEPFLPTARKRIIVTVTERSPWYTEVGGGFSTGEGIRARGEIGNRNLAGRAISLSLTGQASYLPTIFIERFVQDRTVYRNFVEVLGDPGFDTRIAARVNASLQFPTIGLGPDVRGVIDSAFVHDLQRDYYVRKLSFAPTLALVPSKKLLITLGPSLEYSDARIFAGSNIEEFLRSARVDPRQVSALLVPDGANIAFAQKLTFTWDRRDNRLDPTTGTFFFLSIEHVDAYPQGISDSGTARKESHFMRIAQTISGYVPIYRGLRVALQLRLGANFQLSDSSSTYPDRLFFLGGTESMRAWFPNSYIPQDDIDRIRADTGKADGDPTKFTARSRPVRGGNLMVNPRIEFRIPIFGPLETVVFGDFANLWGDLAYPFRSGSGLPPLRMSLGSGLRFKTVFPIAVDVGWNPTRSSFDDLSYAVNFSIGLF
jgi:outer membrane protein insertion porin family